MNTLLAWITGLALAIGIGILTNIWLGIAVGCAWALYVRRTRQPAASSVSGRETRAYTLKERIQWMEDAIDDDDYGCSYFMGSALLIMWAVDKIVFNGSLFPRDNWKIDWREIFSWRFASLLALLAVLSLGLRMTFFRVLRFAARIRYPEFDAAFPLVEELQVRDGVFAWGDLHLDMTPEDAAEVIGYEAILATDASDDQEARRRWVAGQYRGRQVRVYWRRNVSDARIVEISLTLKKHESKLGEGVALSRIHQKFPVLREQGGELWLHANVRSALHLSMHNGVGTVHLINADVRSGVPAQSRISVPPNST